MLELTPNMRNSGALEIKERLASVSGGRILDVGTSDGGFIEILLKTLQDYEEIVGIDISEEDLEKAREKFTNDPVSFELMNAESLSYDDESFDTVCISYTIHHLEKINAVLLEMMRVLKPGGYFILQEGFSDSDQSDAQISEILVHHLDAKVDRMKGCPHFETLSRQQLRDFVTNLGLSEIEVFESSKSLHCLFCEIMEKCEDPRGQYRIEYGIQEIDEILERAAELPSFDEIQEEAEILKERVRKTGHEGASQLFFLCKK
jgi:ubiquinone/menaquinone biosynthesis C-methylase UbiE